MVNQDKENVQLHRYTLSVGFFQLCIMDKLDIFNGEKLIFRALMSMSQCHPYSVSRNWTFYLHKCNIYSFLWSSVCQPRYVLKRVLYECLPQLAVLTQSFEDELNDDDDLKDATEKVGPIHFASPW